MDEDFEQAGSAAKQLTKSINDLIFANKQAELSAIQRAQADKDAAEAAAKTEEEENKYKNSKKDLTQAAKQLGMEFVKMTEAGIKFASTIGTQATQGVKLELQNRFAAIKQIATLDANRVANIGQIKAAEQSLTDTFVSVREGFELSADGAANFANNLKGGFKSEFQLTNESLRALVVTGMSTEAQFEKFRKASGRASLSSGQFANAVNKNTLSFLLYGPKFAKAAVDAERLGISLSGVQAAQEGLVTNLDGTIDTVAQLNQLGAQLDFGTLIRVAEQEGPDALLAYARATIPANMLQSASTRALFKQLGISAEDFLKAGGQQQSAANDIEAQMTKAAAKTKDTSTGMSILTYVMTFLTKAFQTAMDTFGGLGLALFGAIKALNLFAASAASKLPGAASVAGGLGKALQFGTGAAIGLGGAQIGRSMVEGGNKAGGMLTGGALAALGTAIALAPFTGGASLAALALAGGVGGGIYAGMGKPANDLYSGGYGRRILVTPNGAFALNNADDIIAGTNLFPAGTLQTGGNNSDLIRKVDNLITALSNANTTITVGGNMQTVPRMQLVGVYSRNEVR